MMKRRDNCVPIRVLVGVIGLVMAIFMVMIASGCSARSDSRTAADKSATPEQKSRTTAPVTLGSSSLVPHASNAPATADGTKVEAPIADAAPATAGPTAATGDPVKDWALEHERTENGPEADLVVRTGDINNLGFGWPQGFDPFSGQSTPPHPWPNPDKIPANAPEGTDRIMIGSALDPPADYPTHALVLDDGYSGVLQRCEGVKSPSGQVCKERQATMPQPIRLAVGALPAKVDEVLFQMFVDDFQAKVIGSHFQVSLNGTRIPSFEYAINSLDQTGPIGNLVSVRLLPEYWPLFKSAEVNLLIDDPTTKLGDGYAVDFVRILVNPHNFKYQVALAASVLDADTHKPISGATVTAALQSASTDHDGKCQLSGIPAGLVIVTAAAPGYDENSVSLDLVSGKSGDAEIQLHHHDEGTAALERAVQQTG